MTKVDVDINVFIVNQVLNEHCKKIQLPVDPFAKWKLIAHTNL